jgi:hypothetical protein
MYSKANLKLTKKLAVLESAYVPPLMFYKSDGEMIPSDKLRVKTPFVQIGKASSGA